MQLNVRRALNQAARADLGEDTDPADIVEDFGFSHDPREVLSCWFALRNWGVLPVAGGWLDQPISLRNDLNTLQAVYNEEVDALRQRIPTVEELQYFDEQTGAEIKLGFGDG